MLEKLATNKGNVLAIEIIDGFTETDGKLCQKFFQQILDEGFEQVNLLVKLDEMKVGQSSIKAFMEDSLWVLRNFNNLGHVAIVAHSSVWKAMVPIENMFFERASKGRDERYFDISQMEEAFKFVDAIDEQK